MKQPTASDALRLFLIASLGVSVFACESSSESTQGGDGDSIGGGDGDGSGGSGVLFGGACTNPTPFVEGEDTGFLQCDEGYVQRTERVACPSVLPRDNLVEGVTGCSSSQGGAGGAGEQCGGCSRDSDCAEGEYCTLFSFGVGSTTECRASCVTDSDCDEGQVCLCGEEFGTCQWGATTGVKGGGCNTDRDCADEEICAGVLTPGPCGERIYTFLCTPFVIEDLEADGHTSCSLTDGALSCQQPITCGRPFLVLSENRKAELTCRGDWCLDGAWGGETETSSGDEQRQVAATYFEKIALMEHASIAAFARFQLQLLSLGAPAKFVEATNEALIDETKHARLAFSLASRFGGAKVGPGRLDVGHALEDDSPEAILTTTILEGCVGETMAALEARAALVACEDAEVREALEQIAEDESRHAQLAWQVVQWMLEERPELRDLARQVFDEALATRPEGLTNGRGAPALGVLGDWELRRVHAEAREKVVGPCAAQMFRALGRPAVESHAAVLG